MHLGLRLQKPGSATYRSRVKSKHRQYLRRAASRIEHARKGGKEDWAQGIEAKAAEIVAARLLNLWPYDEGET